MSTTTRLILGIVIGIVVSLVMLALMQIAVTALAGKVVISITTVAVLVLMGSLVGAVSVALSYITAGKERTVLVLLVGIALAAALVMTGSYGNGSLLPLAIYGMTAVGSLLIARATAVLGELSKHSERRDLRV